jgi:hypothetical protein
MKEFPGGGTTCTAKEQFFGYLQEWLLNARREVDINMDERPMRYMPASFYTIFVKQRLCLEAWHINMSNHALNRDDGAYLPEEYMHLIGR